MKKYFVTTIILFILCLGINTLGFAAENKYVKRETVNTVCEGINGEKVSFIGSEGCHTFKMNLQVKNLKTGRIDLNLPYTSQRNDPGFTSNYIINRINLSQKSFWVITAMEGGPRYCKSNKVWVVGEYKGQYVVFLTEAILGQTPP